MVSVKVLLLGVVLYPHGLSDMAYILVQHGTRAEINTPHTQSVTVFSIVSLELRHVCLMELHNA